MADGGKVIIKIDGDNKGFKSAMGGIGKVAKTAFKGVAVGATAAVAAIGAIGTAAVKSFAEYEQLIGGVETLFKDSANVVKGYAEQAYKTAGMSANEYMSTVTSFSASLLQSLGGDTAKAAEYGNQAVIDMSDNANKMGTSIEMIQNAYQGFAKQNYTMLDNLKLGYGGTKTEMERLLKDAEKISGLKFDISSFADVTQAIHIIQTEMGITGTTAKEAATTIQGSASMMKSAWNNLLTGITDDTQNFDKLLDNFIDSVKIFGSNILPAAKKSLSGIGNLIEKGINTAIKNSDKIIKGAKDTLISFVKSITSSIPQIKPLGVTLEFIINNLKQLTIAIVSAVATYKTLMIIQTISNAYKTAVPAITAYTIATQASQNVSLLMASTMKPLELLFGLMTGKIELQTIATLALAAAKKLLAGHMGLIVTAISAVVVGITAYIASQNKMMSNTAIIIEQAKERQKVLAEEKQAYDELKQSQIEQATSDLAQVAQTQVLNQELKGLVDANGAVNEANRARVSFILGELNSAYGTEYQLIDGVIKGYQDMQTEIDNLIEKKKYEIVQKAALPMYEEAIKNEINNRIEAEKDLQKVKEQQKIVDEKYLNMLQRQAEAEEISTNNKGNLAEAAKATAKAAEIEYNREKAALDELQKTYDLSFDKIEQAQEDKLNYQKAAALASEGLYNDAIGVLSVYTSEFHTKMAEVEGDIGKQKQIAEEEFTLAQGALQTYLNNVASGVEEFDEGTLRQLITYATEVAAEAKKVGADIGDGMITGLDGKKFSLVQSAKTLASSLLENVKSVLKIKSPSRVFRDEVGLMVTKGLAVGIDKGSTEVEKVMNEMNKTLLASEQKYLDESERLKNSKNESDKKYLDDLKEIADKERKIYDARLKDIENWQKSAVDAITKLAEQSFDKLEEVEKLQETFSKKLKDYGDLFTIEKIGEIGGKTIDTVVLGDLKQQTDVLKKYADTLNAIKDRGVEVPQEFFAELRDLDVIEGTRFASKLLSLDDKDFAQYINDWKQKQQTSNEIAKLLYEDEAETAQSEVLSSFETFNQDLEKQGKENAEAWGDGFYEKIKEKIPDIISSLNSYFNTLVPSVSYAYAGGGGSSTVSKTYSPTYYIQPSQGENTRSQLKAVEDYETLKNARGAYDK